MRVQVGGPQSQLEAEAKKKLITEKEIKVLEKVVFFTFNSLDEIIGNYHHLQFGRMASKSACWIQRPN